MNVQDEGYLGTWNYTVDDAPFGFQKGKVIFFYIKKTKELIKQHEPIGHYP